MEAVFRKISHNFFVSSLGKALGMIISLFTVSLTTHFLGKDGFGEYTIILTFLYFFGVVADGGLYLFLIREISKKGSNENFISSNIITLKFFLAFFIILLAPIVSLLFPYSSLIQKGILFGTLAYFFQSLSQILTAIFQKKLKMWVVSLSEVLGRSVSFSLVVVFIYFKGGVLSFILALIAGNFIALVFSFFFARKLVEIKTSFDFKYWGEVLKKSFPFTISVFLSLIYFKIDTILLSLLKSNVDVGIYGAAYKILETVIVFPAMFTGLFLPFLTAFLGDLANFKEIATRAFKFLIIFSFGAICGGFMLAGPIVKILAGDSFLDSVRVLEILIFAVGIIFISSFFGHLIVVLDLQKKMNKIYFFCVILNIFLNLIFIPIYSYIAAAYITVLTEILVLISAAFIVYKKLNWLPKIDGIANIFFSALLMVFFLFAFRGISFDTFGFLKLFFIIIASFLIYFISLTSLKVLNEQEIRNIFSIKNE